MDKYINVAEIAFAFKEEEVAAQYGGKNDISTGVLFALDTLELDMPESIVRCRGCWKGADGMCSYRLKNVPGKDFCGDGERRRDD